MIKTPTKWSFSKLLFSFFQMTSVTSTTSIESPHNSRYNLPGCPTITAQVVSSHLATAIRESVSQTDALQKLFLLFSRIDNLAEPYEPYLIDAVRSFNVALKSDLRAIDPLFIEILIRCLILTEDPILLSERNNFFNTLYQFKYFTNIEKSLDAFIFALKSDNSLAFKELLNRKNVIPNRLLWKCAKYFDAPDMPNLKCLDLFHLLEKEDYKDKKWRHLTTYEKLNWLVFNNFEITRLGHRLSLEGEIQPTWQGRNLQQLMLHPKKEKTRIDLEGQTDGRGLLQLKQSLLLFQIQHTCIFESVKAALATAIEQILSIEPRMEHHFKHRLKDKYNHMYLFGCEDEHFTTGYHTLDGKYYQINMGYLSQGSGIHIYHVPADKRAHMHALLTNAQYNHKTKHLNDIPGKANLEKYGYIKLPKQASGNCTYENMKGLFCTILFDELAKGLPTKKAYIQTMDLYRAFCEYDFKEALEDYQCHALTPNFELLKMAMSDQQINIQTQVYHNDNFCYHYPEHDERPALTHQYQAKPKSPNLKTIHKGRRSSLNI